MIIRKQQGFCTWKTSICSFFPKWQVQGSRSQEALCDYMVRDRWNTPALPLWISLSVSYQTVRFCSFQNSKRKKKKITKPLNLFKVFLHMSRILRFQKSFEVLTLFSVSVSAAAGNKSATRPPLPPPACGGEWKETGRKLVGRDKGSLTEQQTEGKQEQQRYR